MKSLNKLVDHPLKILLLIIILYIGLEICYQVIGPKNVNYGLNTIKYLNKLNSLEPSLNKEDLIWWHNYIEKNSYDNPADSLAEFIGSSIGGSKVTRGDELYNPHGYFPYAFNSNKNIIRMRFRVFKVYERSRGTQDTVSRILESDTPQAIADLDERCKTINRNEARALPRVTGMFWWPKFENKEVRNEYDYFWCSDIKSYISFKYYRSSNPMKVFIWYLPEN